MKITGIHPLRDPFLGSGALVLNGRSTENLKKMPLSLVLDRITSLDVGVSGSLDANGCLVLDSGDDFTVAGHQDVLDVIGLTATT